jgi:ABC-type nitrate/sulfonate/bicarbonate transport system substrate-binding protein
LQEGVEVQGLRFANANQAMDAFLSGDIDVVSVVGYSTLLPLFEKDQDSFRVVQTYVETKDKPVSRILVMNGSPIRKIEDLAGKKIGTYNGLTQKVNVQLILAHVFEKPEDVEFIQVDESLQIPSLVSGRFDALFAIEPITTIAMEKEGAQSISDSPRTTYILDPFPAAATVFSTEFMQEQPLLASRTLKAFEAAAGWIGENPTEAALTAARPEYTQLDAEIAGNCSLYDTWNLGEEDRTVIQEFSDILTEEGVLTAPLAVDGLFAERADFR